MYFAPLGLPQLAVVTSHLLTHVESIQQLHHSSQVEKVSALKILLGNGFLLQIGLTLTNDDQAASSSKSVTLHQRLGQPNLQKDSIRAGSDSKI